MTNLINYEKDGLEIWVDESTRLAYISRTAIARLLGVDPYYRKMLRLLEMTATFDSIKRIEIYTYGGTQWHAVYPAFVLLRLAIEFNLELAGEMIDRGANAYLLGLSGYTFRETL